MNKKHLFSYPIVSIGLTMMLLGVRWLLVKEPWMLDEVANVERLGMSFEQLFKPTINETLPDYLRQIYRFFGFWVLIIGLFITSFSMPGIAHNSKIRIKLLSSLF